MDITICLQAPVQSPLQKQSNAKIVNYISSSKVIWYVHIHEYTSMFRGRNVLQISLDDTQKLRNALIRVAVQSITR